MSEYTMEMFHVWFALDIISHQKTIHASAPILAA